MKTLAQFLEYIGFKPEFTATRSFISTKRKRGELEDWVSVQKTYKGYECDLWSWASSSFGKHKKVTVLTVQDAIDNIVSVCGR